MKYSLKTVFVIFLCLVAHLQGQAQSKHKVTIQSEPSGAKVYINQKFVRETPCAFNIPTNFNINVLIKKAGFTPWQQQFTVTKPLEINARLSPLTLFPFRIFSEPAGAEVHINGKLRGYTPYGVKVPDGKSLNVVVRKENFQDWEETIEVNENIRKSINLVPLSGSKKKFWIISGVTAAAGTGLVYYLMSQNNEDGDGKKIWPQPPARPN